MSATAGPPAGAIGPRDADVTGMEIIVVPHTHWDREWYEPFQRFRLRLVAVLDQVLERMDRDPRQRFTLDGQLAAVDDYLEVRPGQRDRITHLVRTGRLAIGPWQILLDEFLCSGENIVRNLERGLRRCAEFGAAMPIGYLPDMFGHAAQMPQLLAGAGLAHACVWRGVPALVGRHAFAWHAPDGTAIRTEYLPGGYGNAASLMEDPRQIRDRAIELAGTLRMWRDDGDAVTPALAMYGADHGAPAPDAPDLLDSAAAATGVRMRLGTLAEYAASQPTTVRGLTAVVGELRSHARANILPGVHSARIPLKRAMGRAERMVERYAEPLAALWHDDPSCLQGFLDMAWTRLIESSCHDSVTGCGCDETAQQVAARLAEAEQLGRAVCDLVGDRLADPGGEGYLVFNPTPAPRTGLIQVDVEVPAGHDSVGLVATDGTSLAVQTLARMPTVLADERHDAADLPRILARVHGRELFGREIVAWSVRAERSTLTFHVAERADEPFNVTDVGSALATATAGQTGPWRVLILDAPRHTIVARVPVPALGHAGVRPVGVARDGDAASPVGHRPVLGDGQVLADCRALADGRVLDNGLLRVEVADDGTLALHTPEGVSVAGVGRLVDGGDVGDTYNYAPPGTDRVIDTPGEVRVTTVHSGPLLAVVEVARGYAWPASADLAAGVRAADRVPILVTTRIELRAGEPFVRVGLAFDNQCDDHRVRWHAPLPAPARHSYAEGQFAVVRRGLTAEGGCGEVPLPTFPAAGFVTAGADHEAAGGSLAVLLSQPSEYELVDGGRELALTVLRAVGMLSRNRHALRDEPAGPQLATPQAQCHGPHRVDFALLPFTGGWWAAGVPAAAERFRHELVTFRAPRPGAAATGRLTADRADRTGLRVDGAGVVLTSVRARDGLVEVRVVAEHPWPTTAVLGTGRGIRTARRADLVGRGGQALPVGTDGTVRLPLRAWEIATVQLEPA